MRLRMVTTILAALTIVPSLAYAGDRTETVKFKAGQSSATVTSSLRGYDAVNYMFDASAGQAISIVFDPDNRFCYYTVTAPGSDQLAFDGTMDGNNYDGTLTATGTYKAMVFLMRNAARRNEICKFSMKIAIKG